MFQKRQCRDWQDTAEVWERECLLLRKTSLSKNGRSDISSNTTDSFLPADEKCDAIARRVAVTICGTEMKDCTISMKLNETINNSVPIVRTCRTRSFRNGSIEVWRKQRRECNLHLSVEVEREASTKNIPVATNCFVQYSVVSHAHQPWGTTCILIEQW